jgi:hypothetical protein
MSREEQTTFPQWDAFHDNRTMPQSWSDWVAFIGAVIGTVTGILGLVIAYAAILRDRSDVRVKLTAQHSFKSLIENAFPGVKYGPHYTTDVPHDWYVLSAVNTGLRPVHIEKVVMIFVDPKGPGSISSLLPHDALLNEEHRRTSLAFDGQFGPGHQLWSVAFVDDTGREHFAFGPAYNARLARYRWKKQKARRLAMERATLKQVTPKPEANDTEAIR